MFSIAYVIPYFGKLRKDFPLWAKSCEYNPTVDFYVVTDDMTYNNNQYKNIHFIYMTFNELKIKVQSIFDFKISLETPYKLCDYKPAYGEIFEDMLSQYDFWGHCDMDLIFGNIREFITQEILEKYDRVGKWGHSILYRNNPENNRRYRREFQGLLSYRKVYSVPENYFFDEMGVHDIYNRLGVETYTELKIADIHPSYWQLQVISDDEIERQKNKHRIFYWNFGKLESYAVMSRKIYVDTYMYIHFLRRPINLVDCDVELKNFLIVPNTITNVEVFKPEQRYIVATSRNRMDKYWISLIKRKWRVATPRKIYVYFKGRIRGTYRKIFKNGQ